MITGVIRVFWVMVLGLFFSEILWGFRHFYYWKGPQVHTLKVLKFLKPENSHAPKFAFVGVLKPSYLHYSSHIIGVYVRSMHAAIRRSKRLQLHRLIVYHVHLFCFSIQLVKWI